MNISLSPELAKVVESAIKKGRYSSKSEFFRDLLRRWVDEQSYSDVLQSEKEFSRGKGKRLKSLRELR